MKKPEGGKTRDLVPSEDGVVGSLSQRLQSLGSRQLVPVTPIAPATAPAAPLARAGDGGRGDAEFHPGRLDTVESPASPISGWVFLALFALLASALAWSYFGRLASYTATAGKIQAAGRTKVLEALEKGQVLKINVRNGDKVKTGAILVELDPTSALATRTIIDQKLTDLRAEALRRKTETGAARVETVDPKAKIPWGKDVPKAVRTREDGVAHADLARLAAQLATLTSQKHAKEADRAKYEKSIVAQKALVATTQENMAMIKDLQERGYNSKAKYLDFKAQLDQQQVDLTSFEGSLENAKQSILLLDSQIAKTRESFVTTNVQAIAIDEQQIVDLTQQLVKADQILSNMTLRSPVDGTVHAMGVTTIGQVVKAGAQLMQIVPSGSPLEIETYVSNSDIGFIRVGDLATVKVNTFTYGTYGSIDGTVTSVSNDALPTSGKDTVQSSSLDGEYTSTTTAQKTGTLQFPVIVRTAKSSMMIDGKEVPLVPGMSVSVEIETEKRRAIDYIVSPILELFSTAAHEK